MSETDVRVSIGEVKTGKRGKNLVATLGSCVGIGFIWKEKKICGLAHCLLGIAPQPSVTINARYVSQAIPSLIALMHIGEEDRKSIEVVVVGGGNMTAGQDAQENKLVGAINVEAATQILDQLGFKISHKDVLGIEGRQIRINCDEGTFKVNKIPRLIEV